MSELPDKPSELIRLALADLRKCEADPRYEIDMDQWHMPIDGKCCVCLAGAVMGQSLSVMLNAPYEPGAFNKDTARKLHALDSFRCGGVSYGLFDLGLAEWEYAGHLDIPVMDYCEDPEAFHIAMCKLADDLEKAGL